MRIKKNLPVLATSDVASTPAPIEPEVLPSLGDIEEPDYTKPQERIAFHLGMAQHHGRQALAHLILAGWELALQIQSIGYGGWNAWCKSNLNVCKLTADRYITVYSKLLGVRRYALAIPLTKKPTKKELSEATVGMEQKSVSRAMIDLGIIKRIKNENGNSWGGPDRNQGRKPKVEAEEVAAELEAVTQSETVLWASAKGSLDNLVKLDAERDVMHRLSDEHLATVVSILGDLAKKAAAAFKQRRSGRDALVAPASGRGALVAP